MPAADRDVVEEDVAVGMPAGRRGGLVEQEAGARVGPALDDQQRRTRRQPLDARDRALGARCAGASSSLRKSARKTDVVSTVTSSDVWSVVLFRHPLLLTGAVAMSGRVRPTGFPPAVTVDVSTVPRTVAAMCPPPPDPATRGSVRRSGMHRRRAQGTLTIVIRPPCRGSRRRPAAAEALLERSRVDLQVDQPPVAVGVGVDQLRDCRPDLR